MHIPSLELTMKPRLSLNSLSPPASDPQVMRLYCWHKSPWFHRLSKFGNKCFSLLPLFSAPNPVRNLSVKTQTNSSITLSWDEPEGHDTVNLIYWIQWLGDDTIYEIENTTDTILTLDGLKPASSFEFVVWVEYDGIRSTTETINTSTGESRLLYSFFLLKGRVKGVTGKPIVGGAHFNPSILAF